MKYSLLGGALTGQSAIFDMAKRNVLNPNATDPFVRTQIGQQRSKGFETELTIDVRRGTYVSATYTYLDAVVENDKKRSTSEQPCRTFRRIWPPFTPIRQSVPYQ